MTDTSANIQESIEKIHIGAVHPAWVSLLVALFVVMLQERSRFFGLHLPAWSLDSCSVCQLVTLSRGEFAGKKREGSNRASAYTSGFVIHPNCPSAWKKKTFLLIIVFLLFFLWWKECRCKVAFADHTLVCRQAFYIILEQSIY